MTVWRHPIEAEIGNVALLKFKDAPGVYDEDRPFFLHEDGDWYEVKSHCRNHERVMAFKLVEEQR